MLHGQSRREICDCKKMIKTPETIWQEPFYGVYRDKECSDLITQMPATDSKGASKVTVEKTQDVVYVKRDPATGKLSGRSNCLSGKYQYR